MKVELQKKHITAKEEPTYDIRNDIPEINDEIEIYGDINKIITKKEFNYLSENYKVIESGFTGTTSYIKLQRLFTLKDIKKKIKEICEEGDYHG